MPVEQIKDRITLKHPDGASAEILFYGATVVSWKARDNTSSTPSERLFVSGKAALNGSKPVRGGIPVVFPCFGPPEHPDHARLSQHGFARNEVWNFEKIVMDNDAGVSVRLNLLPRPSIAAVYDKPFELAFVVTLSEHQLSTDLHVANPSRTSALEFQALLHTYIRAPAQEVLIQPLSGRRYVDKVDNAAIKEENRGAVDVRHFTDSVYEEVPDKIIVSWPNGGLVVKKTNFPNVTIWNPGAEAGSRIGDMEPGGWERFVCVEPGFVRGFKQLSPGETWIGQQVLSLNE
ncbi:galactose mutarotase-like protein [Vararia minispora EC-137]|uniref:Galactose mutarotase-like protein n=1 Tax=Vararia minispora EC-137 TaxID=1314806 RepID=A0ACB8QN68_9AGAM|nr:galactose mutarotase-like protein [Vararia minispora EC-137]